MTSIRDVERALSRVEEQREETTRVSSGRREAKVYAGGVDLSQFSLPEIAREYVGQSPHVAVFDTGEAAADAFAGVDQSRMVGMDLDDSVETLTER